jgi:hypothetical protein
MNRRQREWLTRGGALLFLMAGLLILRLGNIT